MKIALLGSSRGLGKGVYELLVSRYPESSFFISSRKGSLLKAHSKAHSNTQIFVCDFTKEAEQELLWVELKSFSPTHIFCIAGGGVHGEFYKKEMKDHLWTLQLNLIFPMKLAHFCLNTLPAQTSLVFVGSSVAENTPDPLASSYCSAKHGLRGFVTTLQKENPNRQIILVSPPYMDTDLLPAGAWPRREGIAQSANSVAQQILTDLNL